MDSYFLNLSGRMGVLVLKSLIFIFVQTHYNYVSMYVYYFKLPAVPTAVNPLRTFGGDGYMGPRKR